MDYAIKSLKMRADSGDVNAMVELGRRFSGGDGVKKNFKKALKYLEQAASQRNAEAFVELGKLHLKTGSMFTEADARTKAEEAWTRADGLGSVEAAYLIGRLYCQAGYVARNRDKAEDWYKRAADKGYAPAQYELGDLYLNKYDGREKESFELIKKAAEGGVAEAYETLGNFYAFSEMGIADKDKAIAAYNAAAKAGITSALTMLASYYMDNGETKKGIEAYEQAAEQGDNIAMQLLGDNYYFGDGVERDYSKAFYWYNRAADKYYPHTFFGVARCYLYGNGVERDIKKAVKYLKRAADIDRDAMYELGNCYFNGWGVKQDKDEAKRLWEKSAEKDCEDAQKALEENF